MFRDRAFMVKVVKDPDAIPETPPIDLNELAQLITRSAVICIVAYVGADTVRRAIIYGFTAKF